MNVSRSGSATGSRSDDTDDALSIVHPHMHPNDPAEVEEGSGEDTPGTGDGCDADEDGEFLLTHSQSDSPVCEQQQSSEPPDQLTGRCEENAVPIYY
jgi:hypothetical protein